MRTNEAYRPIHFTWPVRKIKHRPSARSVRVMPFSKWRVKVVKRLFVDAKVVTFYERGLYFVRVARGLKYALSHGRKYVRGVIPVRHY